MKFILKKYLRRTALALPLLMLFTSGLTGCTCGVLSQDAWRGSERCHKQWQAERDAAEMQSQRELPALQKRADEGDVKAQFAMGQFHVAAYHNGGTTTMMHQHPNADRSLGLAYYYKAGLQGDLQAQRIFATETLYDCRARKNKLRKSGAVPSPNLPQCTAEWGAMDALAKNQCAC